MFIPDFLICPNCAAALIIGQRDARCANGHLFDRAREGYFNLLVGGRLPTDKVAGDTSAALLARRRFLEGGHYQPISDALGAMIGQVAGPVLDVGCGEGYYLSRVRADRAVGLDISKAAIKMAARQYGDMVFVVGSAYRLPVQAQSVAVVLSVFAQRPYEEFQRVLRDDGLLVTVSPGSHHLRELTARSAEVDSIKQVQRAQARTVAPFSSGDSQRVRYKLALSADASRDLVQMTPLNWQSEAHQRLQTGLEAVTVDVWVNRVSAADLVSHPTKPIDPAR